MAFHVGCPITCKRICYCPLYSRSNGCRGGLGSAEFSAQIAKLQHFLQDPWLIRVREGYTIQVPVPPLPPPHVSDAVDHDSSAVAGPTGSSAAGRGGESAQTKRVALQKKGVVAEGFAKRFESTAPLLSEDASGSHAEEQVSSNGKALCRLCFSGEIEGSENAMKMIPCTDCGKRYHKACVTKWSQYRDLFHWSSWKCPSCRTCKVCRSNGEPNKLKFCKRCDGAFHCYCMQPPHKNVSSGPYLCSKHMQCHSCGSKVPGNGLSVRWFLGYTCCDACGRLFTKGNYCPACLKVYRDSEATPMVCCDICQRWVHLQCDGISDERYLQFQIDRNLTYTCPACRGECSQLRSLEDAVQELWRRRDEEDRDLIASLRAAAGLPTDEEIFSISPFSDDEDNGPCSVRGDHVRSRSSSKKLADMSPKKIKESGYKPYSKKHGKKRGDQIFLDGNLEAKVEEYNEPQLFGSILGDKKDASHQPGPVLLSSHLSGSLSPNDQICSNNEQGVLKQQSVDEVRGNNMERRGTALQMKSKKMNDTGSNEDGRLVASKPKTVKGTKLVIHLGGRNKTMTNSPRSDSSSYHRNQELAPLSGGNETAQQRIGDYPSERLDGASKSDDGCKVDDAHVGKGQKPRDRNIIKLGKGKSEALSFQSHRGNGLFGLGSTDTMSSKKRNEASVVIEGLSNNASKGEKVYYQNHPYNRPDLSDDNSNKLNKPASPALDASVKESRPLLKLKFKTPSGSAPNTEEDRVSVKGQRSKRKRTSFLMEKPKHREQEDVTESQGDNLMKDVMDANWILEKLGNDAIGKRVEVQLSDNSWHKGVVSDVVEGTLMFSIDFDDGSSKTLELGKHRIRFAQRG